MRKLSSGVWVDTNCRVSVDGMNMMDYRSMLSPALTIIPFVEYINTTRASLTNIYLSQAVCRPACIYEGCVTVVPEYQEDPMVLSDSLVGCDPAKISDTPG